ncbi:hypothetical protein DFH27DRAFT_340083 [Peziza echinospora]|nr:hypothetical protein DFH27DRAFT_340083 [Peziza echinospora]
MPKDRSRSRSPSRTRQSHSSRHHRHRSPSSTRSESADHHHHRRSTHKSSSDRPRERRDRDRDHRDRDRDRDSHHHSSRHHHHSTSSRHQHHHHRSSSKRSPSPAASAPPVVPARSASPPPVLPYNSRPLTKHDFGAYEALFAEYLDVQKGIEDIKRLREREVLGRFKRFVSHWNRGELAKGWYDPSRRVRAIEAAVASKNAPASAPLPPNEENTIQPVEATLKEQVAEHAGTGSESDESESEDEDSDDDIVGPTLPGMQSSGRKAGAKFPTVEELEEQKERDISASHDSRAQLRHDRKLDRAMQRAQLDEIAPRAAAGTHERKVEKKKELNDKMRSFREKSAEAEVDEATLMGGGGGGTDNFKQMKAAKDRKKNERELRKEAMLRSRMEERDMKLRAHKEKEDKTIAMLKALAENAQRRAW